MNPTLTLEEIYKPIEAPVRAVPDVILDILETDNALAGDVIRYFFSGKGKLLRPALTLFGALAVRPDRDWNSQDRRLQNLAASYEIFHAATLIHDDIIDASYVRRNLPTVNVKWNSQTAVLVGDFLHDKAIGCIFESGDAAIFKRFLQTAGTVCDGEIHELRETRNFELTEETYLEIIDKKTAVLLACCLESGGLFEGATPAQAAALSRFGRLFGLAFQIVDDCLDFTGNEHEFGKTLGADAMGGVLTLPVIRLLKQADPALRRNILALFENDAGAERVAPLLARIREFGTVESALATARELSDKARLELNVFADSPARQSLEKLLDYVLERNR